MIIFKNEYQISCSSSTKLLESDARNGSRSARWDNWSSETWNQNGNIYPQNGVPTFGMLSLRSRKAVKIKLIDTIHHPAENLLWSSRISFWIFRNIWKFMFWKNRDKIQIFILRMKKKKILLYSSFNNKMMKITFSPSFWYHIINSPVFPQISGFAWKNSCLIG